VTHPYKNKPTFTSWKKFIGEVPIGNVDLMEGLPRFAIHKADRIVTMGSCFAQHVANYLQEHGFNYYVAEVEAGIGVFGKEGVGIYSARYGNIYTARQALQLMKASLGLGNTNFEVWENEEEHFFADSIACGAVPGGFASKQGVLEARDQLFKSTKNALENADVFIYTLGLTEGWLNMATEQVYSLAPGVVAGEFDSNLHRSFNDDYPSIMEQMNLIIQLLREINPRVRVIVTVSPVALAATHSNQNVGVSNSWSKATLRAVATDISDKLKEVYYFPSFDLIYGLAQAGNFYSKDLRTVEPRAVEMAMSMFASNFTDTSLEDVANINYNHSGLGVLCDEDQVYNL
jgi:GSCFA family